MNKQVENAAARFVAMLRERHDAVGALSHARIMQHEPSYRRHKPQWLTRAIEILTQQAAADQPFQSFRATRTWSDDIGAVIEEARGEIDDPKKIGYIYMGSLHIEQVQDHWPAAAKAEGKWYLLIENTETISDDLEKLERELFDWAVRAGYDMPKVKS